MLLVSCCLLLVACCALLDSFFFGLSLSSVAFFDRRSFSKVGSEGGLSFIFK
jgi:hypothetical protein